MARPRNKKPSNGKRLLVAGCFALVLIWGTRQLMVVRASIMQDLHQGAGVSPRAVEAGNAAVRVTEPVETSAHSVQQHVTMDEGVSAEGVVRGTGESSMPDAPMSVQPQEELSPAALAERGRQIDSLIEAADQALDTGNLVLRRMKLNMALAMIGESARAAEVRSALASLNTGIFLGTDVLANDPYSPLTEIEAGDSFGRIGRRYLIPADLVAQLNPQLQSNKLRTGGGIKIVYGPFHAHILKQALRLDLYDRDMFVCSFPITLDDGDFLPVGTYRVATDGKVRIGPETGDAPVRREWVQFEGAQAGLQSIDHAWFYGTAGPRYAGASGVLSGVRLEDSDLHQIYNVLVERRSLVRVDP